MSDVTKTATAHHTTTVDGHADTEACIGDTEASFPSVSTSTVDTEGIPAASTVDVLRRSSVDIHTGSTVRTACMSSRATVFSENRCMEPGQILWVVRHNSNFFFLKYIRFLALLDYVSRAHEIEICPPSVVRPSVSQLSLNLMHGFLSNFGCSSPEPYARTFFEFLKKKISFTNIFRFR